MQANNKVVIFSSKQMNLAYSSDLVPTIMDWHGVALPSYKIFKKIISYTGRSLLQFPLPSNFLAITVTSRLLQHSSKEAPSNECFRRIFFAISN